MDYMIVYRLWNGHARLDKEFIAINKNIPGIRNCTKVLLTNNWFKNMHLPVYTQQNLHTFSHASP